MFCFAVLLTTNQGIAHQSRVIGLPMHVQNMLVSVKKLEKELMKKAGDIPSKAEVRLFTNIYRPLSCFGQIRLQPHLADYKRTLQITTIPYRLQQKLT